jgi:predicted nucleotide-binding protein
MGWGLQVGHFNRESVAGILVAEWWRQMLNRARFAFAVMTPDHKMKDGRKRARQNVVHEIGLCHARVGLHNTAILLAAGTEKFTNVDGVNYIPFKVGRLAAQQGEIRKLLEARGIL